MNNIIELPIYYDTPENALEYAKGWDFQTVFIVGHTAEGGTKEGGLIYSTSRASKVDTAKDMLHMAELLRYMALKELGLL